MSSAGTIYREQVFTVTDSAAGSDTLSFDVENDGVIIALERISGTASITGSLKSQLPDTTTAIEHDTFTVDSSTVVRLGSVTHRKAKLELTWTGALELRVAIKMASATAIASIEQDDAPFIHISKDTSAQFNTVEALRTQITTTATRISTPDNAEYVWLKILDPTKIMWLGNDANITANGTDTYPVQAGEHYKLHLESGDGNEMYGIVEEGTVNAYILGGYIA